MKPPTKSIFVFDIYWAATSPELNKPKLGNNMYGIKAVTEIGSTSKIQNEATTIKI